MKLWVVKVVGAARVELSSGQTCKQVIDYGFPRCYKYPPGREALHAFQALEAVFWTRGISATGPCPSGHFAVFEGSYQCLFRLIFD